MWVFVVFGHWPWWCWMPSPLWNVRVRVDKHSTDLRAVLGVFKKQFVLWIGTCSWVLISDSSFLIWCNLWCLCLLHLCPSSKWVEQLFIFAFISTRHFSWTCIPLKRDSGGTPGVGPIFWYLLSYLVRVSLWCLTYAPWKTELHSSSGAWYLRFELSVCVFLRVYDLCGCCHPTRHI